MNFYIVVEGDKTELSVYPKWIPNLNPNLSQIDEVSKFNVNNFFLISGRGYPNYLQVVSNSVEEVRSIPKVDRLIVIIDSEDMSPEEKINEVSEITGSVLPHQSIHIVVQEKCFESWCLGNRKIVQRNPQNSILRGYLNRYDVTVRDPAHMPSNDPDLTASQFAFKYLSLAMQEKGIYYSKRSSKYVADEKYLFQIKKRALETPHVSTFKTLITALL